MGVIELNGLTKDYGDVLANDDVSFTVETGEIFGYSGQTVQGRRRRFEHYWDYSNRHLVRQLFSVQMFTMRTRS